MGSYLIVGGSRGIGACLARRLAAAGHELAVISRDPSDLPESWQRFAADATKDELPTRSEPLDGLAYCPGSITLKPFHRCTDDDFRRDFELNLLGATRVLRAYRDNLRASATASVVLFSTVAVRTGMANHASIAAAKGAVEGLTRALAAEWAPRIRVNAIAPSLTRTELTERLLRNEGMVTAAGKRHPIERIGTADEVAAQAEFLLGADASWITGQVFHVDGGMSAVRQF